MIYKQTYILNHMDQDKLNESFLIAVTQNDIEKAIDCLQNGASIHALTEKGNNALIVAATRKHQEMFEWLLEVTQKNTKIDINHQNADGATLVYELVKQGNCVEMLEIALKNNADVNKEVYTGMSPLMRACSERKFEEAKLLLDYKANPNAKIKNTDTTPFLLSVSSADLEITKLLLPYADINQLDAQKNNALVNLLMKQTQFLKKKVKEERLALCELLIDSGIDINHSNPTGLTAFWAASLMNEKTIVKKLLDANVDVDTWNAEMQHGKISAMHYWAMRGEVDAVVELHSRGAKLGVPDGNKNTPEAYGFLNPKMRETLLDLGIDVNTFFYQKDYKEEETRMPILSLAISGGDNQSEIVAEMIKRGAEVTYQDSDLEGVEPILLAIATASSKITNDLLATGKIDVNRPLRVSASSMKKLTPLSILVSDLNSSKLQSALDLKKQLESIVKSKGQIEVNGQKQQIYNDEQLKEFEKQLEQFKNVDEDLEKKKIDIFNTLVSAGANVDGVDEYGLSPIFYATTPTYIQCLKDAGANLHLKDNKGNTPFTFAIQNNNKVLIEFFNEEFKHTHPQEIEKVFYNLAFSDVESYKSQTYLENGLSNFIGEENKEKLKEAKKAKDENFTLNIHGINYKDENGNNPVLIACANNLPFLVGTFVKLGAQIDEKNNLGETPLMHAIASENHMLVEFLLEKNANANAATVEGKSVLDFAKEVDNKIILEMINKQLGINFGEGGLSGTKRLKP